MVEAVFGRRDATLENGRHGDAEVAPVMVASEGGVQNRGKLWNGRHWDAEVASRMAGRWEMDARGMLVWRPNREGGENRTPFGRECGVQNCGALGNGRQVRLEVASRMAWCWESDARRMLVWRPKREGRGNRTPGGRECGVQNGRKLWNGRQGETAVASESAKLKIPDAAWRCKWRPALLQSKKQTPPGNISGVSEFSCPRVPSSSPWVQ